MTVKKKLLMSKNHTLMLDQKRFQTKMGLLVMTMMTMTMMKMKLAVLIALTNFRIYSMKLMINA